MANSVVMGASVLEKEMHYPVMTERQAAARWKISLKTLRRWRLDGSLRPQPPVSTSLSRKEVARGALHGCERETEKRRTPEGLTARIGRARPKIDARKPSKHAGNAQEERPTEKGWPWVNGGGGRNRTAVRKPYTVGTTCLVGSFDLAPEPPTDRLPGNQSP